MSTEGALGHEVSKAYLTMDVDSPISQEIHFHAQIVKNESDDGQKLDFKVTIYLLFYILRK